MMKCRCSTMQQCTENTGNTGNTCNFVHRTQNVYTGRALLGLGSYTPYTWTLGTQVGIDVGEVHTSLNPATGRMSYWGKVMNRAARISGQAASSQVSWCGGSTGV